MGLALAIKPENITHASACDRHARRTTQSILNHLSANARVISKPHYGAKKYLKAFYQENALVSDCCVREKRLLSPGCTAGETLPGQYYDSETGLHYNYFRTYDPSTGRYIESDPIGLKGGLNTYGYIGGNPLNYVDPLGLYWFRQSWQLPGVVGRESSPVEPGDTTSEVIEKYVPAGYAFGEMHDAFVGDATNAGYPDWMVNIPSMLPIYAAAQYRELFRSAGLLDQPQPPSEPRMCE